MNPTRQDWQQAFQLLDQALTLEVSQREAWVEALDIKAFPAKTLVRDLLRQRAQAMTEDFLDSLPSFAPLPSSGSAAMSDANTVPYSDAAFMPNSLVGPYRLIKEIGVGGMGTVWLAERADDGLKRQVALKLPRMFLLAGFAERMARERDILASLTHPHIARLYDAGVDASGRPYLALEHVQGEAIDYYYRQRKLSIRERLKLLMQVGSAVAYAHTQLVVHRDLKPSNILVTDDGQVRLLDFGIAKLIEPEASNAEAWTALTKVGERALTVDYASPEQIRGEAIGTASDVYSLGVVAYELLAGARPYRVAQSGKFRQAPLEQMILLQDPPLASTTAPDAECGRALKGDLDAILNKALKKAPTERYPSINAFMEDIRHYLAGEPVKAQPDRLTYRVGKFVKRYKLLVALASTAALAIIGGGTVALWQAQQSAAAEKRSATITQFLIRSLRGHTAEGSQGLTPTAVAERLIKSAEQIETDFAGDIPLQQELYGVFAPLFADLGYTQLALKYGQRHLDFTERYGSGDLEKLAGSALLVARGQMREGDLVAADATLRRTFSPADQHCSSIPSCIAYVEIAIRQQKVEEAARQLNHLIKLVDGDPNTEMGLRIDTEMLKGRLAIFRRSADALDYFERALGWSIAAGGENTIRTANLRRSYGSRLIESVRRKDGFEQLALAIETFRRINGDDDLNAAEIDLDYGFYIAYENIARRAEGRERIARAKAIFLRSAFAAREERLARAAFYEALLQKDAGELERAHSALVPLASDLRKVVAGETSNQRKWVYRTFAEILAQRGEKNESRQRLRELLDYMAPTDSRRNYNILLADMALVRAELMAGELDVAEAVLKDSLAFLPAGFERYPTIRDRARWLRGEINNARGDFKAARDEFAAAHAAISEVPVHDRADRDEALILTGLGEAQCGLNERTEGIANLRLGEVKLQARHHPSSPVLARARAVQGLCVLADGQRDSARLLLKKAEDARKAQPHVSTYYTEKIGQLRTFLAK